jgi:GTP cyclohydrolase I
MFSYTEIGVESKHTQLSWADIRSLIADRIPKDLLVYGVPRGGAVVAAMRGRNVDNAPDADVIVDDIIDSGRTRDKFKHMFPDKMFVALIDKTDQSDPHLRDGWIHFPWEPPAETDIQESVTRILEYIGDRPEREGLKETPARVVRSWDEIFAGYKMKVEDVLCKEFEADGYDELIICRNIDFYSTCEHHLQPFFGRAHVGYIPKRKVVGLSKLARLVDLFARRLQIQERLTAQIADALEEHLQPLGVAVLIEAQHFCMVCRGVRKQNSCMTTSSLKGLFRSAEARAEFFALVARS